MGQLESQPSSAALEAHMCSQSLRRLTLNCTCLRCVHTVMCAAHGAYHEAWQVQYCRAVVWSRRPGCEGLQWLASQCQLPYRSCNHEAVLIVVNPSYSIL